MVLGAKRGAGRVVADRVIICAVCGTADATVAVKLSAVTLIKKNMYFVFIDEIWFLQYTLARRLKFSFF